MQNPCMPSRTGAAHVVTTKRVYKDKVYCTHLLRRSYREDGKVKNETLGNLSHLPDALIDIIRRSLQGETFVPASQAFEVVRSRAHGHVQAVGLAMQRLGLTSMIASTPSRERDLVLAMVAARIVQPDTKLATSRHWHCSTLAEDFGVADATEDDLYAAMDWLLARQDAIEQKLAKRHLREGALVLYDLSSSYFEGSCCPLAKRGYSRDGRPGTLQVNYGLLTDARGCPVAVSVFEGNTSDSLTFLPAVQHVRERFGLTQVVMVGDRGMVSQKAIAELNEKMKEARALEAEMQEFAERRIGQLKQEDMKIRQTLYEEISTVVRDHALKNGYDMVFDKTGVSLSTVPILIFVKETAATDITSQVVVGQQDAEFGVQLGADEFNTTIST